VNVAVGLLDARSGSRSEEWLEWWVSQESFGEMGVHQGLRIGLEEGLRGWNGGMKG
jgi:hypothetical protein